MSLYKNFVQYIGNNYIYLFKKVNKLGGSLVKKSGHIFYMFQHVLQSADISPSYNQTGDPVWQSSHKVLQLI